LSHLTGNIKWRAWYRTPLETIEPCLLLLFSDNWVWTFCHCMIPQYTYIVSNHQHLFALPVKQKRKAHWHSWEVQVVSYDIYMYLCLEVIHGVLYHARHLILLLFLTTALHESDTTKTFSWSVPVCNKKYWVIWLDSSDRTSVLRFSSFRHRWRYFSYPV
jgi:hypothetical protein